MNRRTVAVVRPHARDLKHVCDEYRHNSPQARLGDIAASLLFDQSRPGEEDPVGRDLVANLSGAEEAA